MLANILSRPGKIDLCEIKKPEPSYGEIIVKIKAALTCGTDLKAFKRGHPVIPMPGVFGHEFSGVVAKAGRGVKKFREGDEIMAVHSAPCLDCRYCNKGLYNLCEKIMRTKVLGAFAEYILLPSHIVKQNVFHKPANLSYEEAAFLEPLSCVVHGMKSLKVKRNDDALVIGAGPIGLLHLLLLKEKGANVTVIDKHAEKLRVSKKLGADFTISAENKHSLSPIPLPSRVGDDITIPSIKRGEGVCFPSPLMGEGKGEGYLLMKKFTHGLGFDYVFECTGIPSVWEESVGYVRRGGTVVLFGGCISGAKVSYDAARLHYDEITLRGTFHFTPSDVKQAYSLLCGGRIAVSRLISGKYPLKQTQKAFDKLSKGIGIKYAIIP